MSHSLHHRAIRKELFAKTVSAAARAVPETTLQEYSQRFDQESKKLSQLIALSWIRENPEGQEIRRVLLNENSDAIKALLRHYGIDLEATLGPLEISVNWDSFYGQFFELDHVHASQSYMIFYLPYPPRSPEVTDQQLQEWVNNTDPQVTAPIYPYIPMTGGC